MYDVTATQGWLISERLRNATKILRHDKRDTSYAIL